MPNIYTGKAAEAYRLGSNHRYAGRPMWDMTDEDSALLMDELGETDPPTGQYDPRLVFCDAYEDGYYDASSALGGPLAEPEPQPGDSGAVGCTCVHGLHGYGPDEPWCLHPGCNCTGYFAYEEH